MMDLFSKKRVLLIFGCTVLVIFTYFILQSHWTYTRQLAKQEEKIRAEAKSAASCPTFQRISRCERCPRPELRALVTYCMKTGYKEYIECDNGKKEYIWCDISPAVEENDFWKFQAFWLFLGLSSYSVVYLRQRKLDKILMEKINKQIASGV